MFLKNKNIIFKIRRSKVTDYAALTHYDESIYTEEKKLAIYFGDSQFRRKWTFNIIVLKIYFDKRSQVR